MNKNLKGIISFGIELSVGSTVMHIIEENLPELNPFGKMVAGIGSFVLASAISTAVTNNTVGAIEAFIDGFTETMKMVVETNKELKAISKEIDEKWNNELNAEISV